MSQSHNDYAARFRALYYAYWSKRQTLNDDEAKALDDDYKARVKAFNDEYAARVKALDAEARAFPADEARAFPAIPDDMAWKE